MAAGERCLLVHGHFYQPPRENPWTGQIDPQFSAAPWENWNRRIADECYIPMARSRVHDARGKIVDLYNNYAHTSFNFGPTLLFWIARHHPGLLRHLRDAAAISPSFAMAQPYNHMMLPLADPRDRHTQIVWGLREFHHRFGFHPKGMWLSECGVNPATVRALVDHGVRHLILSPHQASKARPFGEEVWRDVSMGAIDTRRAYRLFETDESGRTHYDRFLDVVFYTPGLNLKVGFDHLLGRPDDLRRELEASYDPARTEAQLVSIVTDGEIYGHHEKRGEEALSRLYREIAPALDLRVVSAEEFIRDNPPKWEVVLWNGQDDRGSSWSCEHGVGRWHRDCGCRPPCPPGWNQQWRGPLRDAFDLVRDRVREASRRELGALVWDADDARDDYISVVLDPSAASRLRFLRRHARHRLAESELERLWRLLEAEHNAMLMYSSCGWFFDEISGLEPVQNMRYALRAAELAQPFHDEDLAVLLEKELAKATSNLPRFADGGEVFRQLVLPSRHSNRELAAAMAVCLAADFPQDNLDWRIVDRTQTVHYTDSNRGNVAWGSLVCHDERMDRFIKTSWVARLDDFDNSAIGLVGYEEAQADPLAAGVCPLAPNPDFSWLRDIESETRHLKRQQLLERFDEYGVGYHRLPEAVRGMLYRRFSGNREADLLAEVSNLGARAVPFMTRACRHGARVPETIIKVITNAFERQMAQATYQAIGGNRFGDDEVSAVTRHVQSARELGLRPSLDIPGIAIYLIVVEIFHWLGKISEPGWLESLVVHRLRGGTEWIAPQSKQGHPFSYPEADELALAMGKGLAELRSRLADEPNPGQLALVRAPLPELLLFSSRIGLDPGEPTSLGIEFWDFLDKPLARLIAPDPASIMAGEAGDRLLRMGECLGFAEDTVRKRILSAMKAAPTL